MKREKFLEHIENIKEFLSEELSKLRVGRATPSLVEDILVEAYPGSAAMPLKELSSITTPDAQSVVVIPWDKSVIKQVEAGIRESGKGLNPVNEGEQIRVPVPPLTEDRRKEMVKDISKIVEQAKIRVRTLRKDAIKSVEEMEENGVISEDDMFREKKEIESDVAGINETLEKMGKEKEVEVMQV